MVERVAVIGAGNMGAGIAQVCAKSGYTVQLTDVNDDILKRALGTIKSGPFGLNRLVEKGKLEEGKVETILSQIRTTTSNAQAVKDADLVIEAAPENLELKRKIFKELDQIAPPESIFASNTSTIVITDLASAVGRADKFIGMHWFNPAPVMKLIEIVRSLLTSDQTYNTVVSFSKSLEKVPIEAKDGPGFFTSRFISGMMLDAVRMFEQGLAGIREIDEMCKLAFGFPMGPFELMDLTGLDISYHAAQYIYDVTGDTRYTPPITLKKMVLAGYTGSKRYKPTSKGGWYDYYNIRKEVGK